MYEIENFVERSGFFELYGIRKKLMIWLSVRSISDTAIRVFF